ncbi:MAG: rod shape-determining protein MreD [Tissierellia bacterium]|nr:rod shape-determining protein MreD [Tissierellia bacterium]
MEFFLIFFGTYLVFVLQNSIFSGYFIHEGAFSILPIGLTFYVMSKYRKIEAPYIGLFLGFLCDVFYGERIGFYMLIWFLIGTIAQKTYGYLNSRSFLTAGILSAFITICYQLFTGIGYYILGFSFSTRFILKNTFHIITMVTGITGAICYLIVPKLKEFVERRKNHGKDERRH